MDAITRRAAVLGSPVAHSLSPVLHAAGYAAAGLRNWEYTRIECTADQLADVVRGADESFRGFSVTMPAKFAALEFADEVSSRAAAIGSANTLVRTAGGWRADNTDCEGVDAALDELLGGSPVSSALVIGAGGTARPALWALQKRGVEKLTVLNRTDRAEDIAPVVGAAELEFVSYDADLRALAVSTDVIVSTVPAAALNAHASALGHAPVFDVIYDPWPTALATSAAANGYRTVGGLSMLAAQSYSQFEQFTGVAAPRDAMRDALLRHML
ncbi:Shikimate dehydrogenase [Corynebacterium capitovis DSM 44611]|uniref:shikimate dehydrogenase n=1 Tax=Corynebacterium capitovis TaxID=131081 RepID=UPI0003695B14|nr:shikimate dehydrogenase [Corynebacterium capitovis]WKD57578.1 Shikimate dehydrogenase [Corynebacterium capitovis DSM 44611]